MNLLTSTMPEETVVETTEATTSNVIAFEFVPGENYVVYPGGPLVLAGTQTNEATEGTEGVTYEEHVVTVNPEGVTGTVVLEPGVDPVLLYGYKPSIWNNAWFVGGLMVLGFALIVGALQLWFMRKRRLQEKELATMLQPVVPTAATVKEAGEIHKSPVPGVVSKVMVVPGQPVRKGQVLCVLETRLTAREDGIVSEITVPEAAAITAGTPVVVIKKVNN